MNVEVADSWIARTIHRRIGTARWLYWRCRHASGRDVMTSARTAVNDRFVDWGWKEVPHLGNDRTAYVIGLFGTGRNYVMDLLREHIGVRAKYIRFEKLRVHPYPTSMIYSLHATIRYTSRFQYLPALTNRILQAVSSGTASLIFVYRHPLDSLLSNWIWWRSYIRFCSMDPPPNRPSSWTISNVYNDAEDMCGDLEQNFLEFQAFAKGDPSFFASISGPRFLSLSEFVEETELFLQVATVALSFEDLMVDTCRQFSKIAQAMSVDLDMSSLRLAPPRSRPYRYLLVKQRVSRFRKFVEGLNSETKQRIQKIGYDLGD